MEEAAEETACFFFLGQSLKEVFKFFCYNDLCMADILNIFWQEIFECLQVNWYWFLGDKFIMEETLAGKYGKYFSLMSSLSNAAPVIDATNVFIILI